MSTTNPANKRLNEMNRLGDMGRFPAAVNAGATINVLLTIVLTWSVEPRYPALAGVWVAIVLTVNLVPVALLRLRMRDDDTYPTDPTQDVAYVLSVAGTIAYQRSVITLVIMAAAGDGWSLETCGSAEGACQPKFETAIAVTPYQYLHGTYFGVSGLQGEAVSGGLSSPTIAWSNMSLTTPTGSALRQATGDVSVVPQQGLQTGEVLETTTDAADEIMGIDENFVQGQIESKTRN